MLSGYVNVPHRLPDRSGEPIGARAGRVASLPFSCGYKSVPRTGVRAKNPRSYGTRERIGRRATIECWKLGSLGYDSDRCLLALVVRGGCGREEVHANRRRVVRLGTEPVDSLDGSTPEEEASRLG